MTRNSSSPSRLRRPLARVRTLSAALPSAPAAQPAPALEALAPLTRVEGITEYQLDNGLRVLLFPDPT